MANKPAKRPASRPSLARKTTPGSEKTRKAALDEGISITVDGVEYTVRTGDVTALDSQALRREVGLSFAGILRALETDADIDLVAAIVWLARRIGGERGLPYEAVASDMGYDMDIDVAGAKPPPGDGEVVDPEGSAGSS